MFRQNAGLKHHSFLSQSLMHTCTFTVGTTRTLPGNSYLQVRKKVFHFCIKYKVMISHVILFILKFSYVQLLLQNSSKTSSCMYQHKYHHALQQPCAKSAFVSKPFCAKRKSCQPSQYSDPQKRFSPLLLLLSGSELS